MRLSFVRMHPLQRRASFMTRKGRCSTLNGCLILPLNRFRFKDLCSSAIAQRRRVRNRFPAAGTPCVLLDAQRLPHLVSASC
ncbi:hypothetical protein ELI24_24155 [Rhizobium ruizarguesonis]|nr:hypothetical protein ELI24_24155 [Rhizobium ruizarguesonis]TAW18718.1 hypothetical protein ELI25_24425 [Rhizobium ruizarguesonis]TAZ54395.1 hypothetical protein ELH76_26270 [Rhizobium ruizarguesonis]